MTRRTVHSVNQTDGYLSRQNVRILVFVGRHYLNINFTFRVQSVGYTAHIYKGKAFLLQPWTGCLGSRKLRLPEFIDRGLMKVV